jgi:DNA polymerase III alpha subunit
MIHLALQTEFSFKQSFLHMKDIHKYVVDGYVGIADQNNTFGHIPLLKEANKHGFKPIFGVRLHVVKDSSEQRVCNTFWTFIAKNNDGLREIYRLTERAFANFYYFPRLKWSDVAEISDNVITISPNIPGADFTACGQGYQNGSLALDNNQYPEVFDREVYELLAGSRKQGTGYIFNFNNATYPQHILNAEEWMAEYNNPVAVQNTYVVARQCDATIPKAEMIKWSGGQDIAQLCFSNKKKVKNWTDEYTDRLNYELQLIHDKGYNDYFLIVSDLIKHAKKTMLVGPARGSSAGSLVCYLLDITEVDPIEHRLIFERFIDINRFDLPDIDIDFPDTKREAVVKYLKHKYGRDKVMCLANVNRLKAKSAIGEFAKGLGIPSYETAGVKGAIIERSSGDARAAMCIADTFETTEPGKLFISKYPAMGLVSRIEDHASHAGKHAAGILVSTLPLCNYGSLEDRSGIIMMDKKDAEYIGLLKIDCLGLRNLSILEGVAEQIGKPIHFYYDLPLNDQKTFDLFNAERLNGIFQFEGNALQLIVKQMGVRNFNDIAAITALARPGALNSGGTARYIKYVTGEQEPTYYSKTHMDITRDTFGIVVYQEQMMEIARQVGGMSWADTSDLRRAASKSMGDEFFGRYKDKFITGALANGYSPEECQILWQDISSSGSWSFNKSHAVSYGLISYWTAWCKANHPMEFAVSSLNNAASTDNAIKLLRDLIQSEGYDYLAVDPDLSGIGWSYSGNTLIGGLTNIKGIGDAKAKTILQARAKQRPLSASLYKLLKNPVTDFDILFPCKHHWGHLYTDPKSYNLDGKPMLIKDINGRGEYVFIGCLRDRNLRDLNEQVFLEKRGGQRIEEYTQYLNLKLEDDTDIITCKIDRYKYEALGKSIAESGRIDKDWYLVRGKIKSDWRKIDVEEIVNLNKYFNVNIK